LTESIINSWYPDVPPGTEGVNIAAFEVKDEAGNVDFMFNDGGYSDTHRLRTSNTKLTRYDKKTIKVGDKTYSGYIYSNKSADKSVYIGVKLNAGDVMTAVVYSNGNAYTVTVEDPEGEVQNFDKPAEASIITYYATHSGIHKIYNGTDEKLVVARVTRQHSKAVKVSGKVEISAEITDPLTLEFTCKESGMVRTVDVVREEGATEGSYEVNLFENYNYDVLVKPTIYVVDEGSELQLGAANEDQTATHNIRVAMVPCHTLSGSIVGLDNDAMSKLAIEFKKPANKIYIPEITINDDMTYTADLESGTEYTIITKGINDYELDSNANNNSDRIRITSPTIGRNITYTKKPVYNVTIEPEGAAASDLATAKFVFTNINEEGYVYTFEGTEGIQLRDGTYSVVVSDSGRYVQMRTTNLVVDGAAVTKKIRFKSDISTWIFSATEGFTAASCTAGSFNGLKLTGVSAEDGKAHAVLGNGGKIEIPVSGTCVVKATYYYAATGTLGNVNFEATQGESLGSTSKTETVEYSYTGDAGWVELKTTATTYLTKIEIDKSIPYQDAITVDPSKVEGNGNYTTINDALAAVRSMNRTDDSGAKKLVTIAIAPGDYEEMLVIDTDNIKLVNASATPSIGLRNKGVDIDPNAVRITSYYGHGYTYYSMGSDCKWDAEILATNKANGYPAFKNPGTGTTSGSYWNATVVINASNVSAQGIIFENSFNQYISKKAAEDIIVKHSDAREGSVPRASMAVGDTKVQEKDYVERAAALAIYNNCAKISFDNCKFVGRQDTLYGGTGVTASFYDCSIYGGTDYIFGGMTAVFAKCDLVFNTNDQTSNGIKNDVGYITAAQQDSGRGYLMYNCHVTSTIPGVDTASQYTSKPGYFGRPWKANTGEAVFYKTIIDEADAHWRNSEGTRISLIAPEGWNSSLSGESALSQEAGTYEVAEVNNSESRVSWANVLTGDQLSDGKPISVATFLGDWNPFDGKDMKIVLPSDEDIAAPAAPTAIVTPEPTKEGEGEKVIKGASIVLSAETGAKVYYLVNPAEDAVLNEESTPYTGAIKVEGDNIKDDSITIKAIAVKYGQPSAPLSVTYTVTEAPDTKAPVLPEAGDIKLGSRIKISADAGAEIYYNVNSDKAPDKTATLYTGKDGIEITTELIKEADSTVTIKAVAILNGKTSEVASATYVVIVNAPTANPKSGYQFPDGGGKVELTADEGVTIYYVTGADADAVKDIDLTNEESGRKTYDKKGITVSADTTIKAVANRGDKYSDVVTLNYIVPLSMPTANPGSGSVLPVNARIVKLTADEGTTVYYTTGTVVADVADPANPESDRKTYDNETGITVTAETTVIKAVAVKGERYSVVAVFTYTLSEDNFEQVEALTAKVNNSSVRDGATKTVNAGTDVTVTLETTTPDADIYYTLDGKTPVIGSNKYRSTGIVITAISETTVIKAFATKKDMLSSEVFTVTIDVKEGGSHGGDDSGLVISFVDEGEGTYEYTGSAIKPEVEVRNNGIPLVPGTDYTVKYSNNINVPAAGATKKPTVTVSGKGILTGKAAKEFTITPKSFEDEAGENKVVAGTIVVAAKKKVPVPSVYYGSTKLKANKDFTYTAPAPYAVATDDATITITGAGNFKDTLEVPVKVVADANAVKTAVKKFNVSVNKDKAKAIVYNGEELETEIKAAIEVKTKDSAKTDIAAENYILVLPKDITNAGTVKFTVVGIGEYSGCNVTKSCKILPRTIAKENVVIDKGGAAAADGKVLVSGITDKATFASTGATFPEMALTYGSDKLDMKLGKDYKVSYSSNKKAVDGKAKYTITFMGNYKGKYVSDTFGIGKAELDTDTAVVVIPDMVCNGKDGVYKSKPYVTINNVTLKASEYKVTYYLDDPDETDSPKEMDKNNKLSLGQSNSKTVYVKIEPSEKSNYQNTDKDKTIKGSSYSYTVWKKGSKETDLSKAKVTFYEGTATKATKKLSYTGNPIELVKLDKNVKQTDGNCYIKVEVNKVTVPADAYEVEYVSNVNKGKATVVIKPADTSAQDDTTTAYTGGKVATFTIAARKLDNKDWFSVVAQGLGIH
ncbi:MAG: hypothetical protein HDR29_00380, partial [Lachnospiraceae bacterium]|nr:hypothetical protein [Lachnospiraceae bacterium]